MHCTASSPVIYTKRQKLELSHLREAWMPGGYARLLPVQPLLPPCN